MLGLFGTLNLGARSLQTQRTAVEVAGQNLANINNPAYARQRVTVQTSYALPTAIGSQGTGAEAVAIRQIRDVLLDNQVRSEASVNGYWSAQQSALQYAQSGLGEYVDSTGAVVSASGTTRGLSDGLTRLFNAFQSVATSPESISERQLLLSQAQSLATRFNETAAGLNDLRGLLDTSLTNHTTEANALLTQIANLNRQIASSETSTGGTANDLRDLRQQKLEELSALVDLQTSDGASGAVNVTIGGVQLVAEDQVLDQLETYDAGGGQVLVRAATAGTALTLTGGRMQGVIDARDGTLATLQNSLNTLAGQLITQVNAVHSAGFGLNGTTGALFFTGTDAGTIGVNTALRDDPARVQAAGVANAPGDNAVALQLARLADTPQAGLSNQTFSDAYIQAVAALGYGLSDATIQAGDSDRIQVMLLQQRDSVSGVSVDEEMSDLIRFQKAYEASAKLVTTVDEMLETILNMKR